MARDFFKNLPDTSTPLTASRINGLLNGEEAMGSIVVDNVECKNILDLSGFTSRTINGVTFTNNNDGSITINGTSNASFGVSFADLKLKAGTYHLSLNAATPNDFYIWDRTSLQNILMKEATATLTKDYDNISLDTWINAGVVFNNITIRPQLEKGDKATPFVQHKEFSNKQTYSTNEQVIGEWLGQPLYRKVIQSTKTLEANTTMELAHGISNLGEVIKTNAMFLWDNKNYPFPAIYSEYTKQVVINYIDSTNIYIKSFGERWSAHKTTIILEYTKTTDTSAVATTSLEETE